MNTKEMRKLDAWIAFHVTGDTTELCKIRDPDVSFFPHYTTDPAASFELLKKCAQKTDQISIVECAGKWVIAEGDGNNPTAVSSDVESTTLELAIGLFAKKLFST